MAKNYDDIGGVWRTIGGRRVFIKTGQNLSDAMKESGKFKLSKKQKEAGNKLNKNAENGIREDFRQVLSGKQIYGGEPKELAKELSNEWGIDLKRTEEILNEETKKYLNEKNMPEGAKFSKMLEESGVRTFADDIKENETGYETYLRDTQGTTNEKLINVGREKENRIDYQKYKDEVIRNINKKRMEKGTTNLNQAYKKAFEEYKKQHPNSKLSLKDFIKMSEE